MTNDSGMITQQQALSTMEAFTAWLYDNYAIGNGHALTRLQEDASVLIKYLKEHHLPSDTELI